MRWAVVLKVVATAVVMAAATELPAYTPFNLADSIEVVVMKGWGTGLCALLFAAGLQAEAVHDTGHHHHAAHAHAHAHAEHMGSSPVNNLKEPGQSAFAAIQEVVATLIADPDTDWSRVNIEALRQHLIDMDNVTLRAEVVTEALPGGAQFRVTAKDADVVRSIQTMVSAHARAMNGVEGWALSADLIENGAVLMAVGEDVERIRGLGFIGLMTVGMHHQAHHLALAKGQNPHAH